jgi:Flp pilus assembly protein TadD
VSRELERAEALLAVHRPDAALEALRPAMAAEPDDPRPHLLAARAHLAASRHSEMRSAAQEALRRDPESAHAARLIAIAASLEGDKHAAEHWAHEAVRREPDDSRAQGLLAELDSIAGRHAAAIGGAEEAVRLDPDDPYPHYVLGLALHRSGRFAAAEQALRHSLTLDPTDAAALTALGETIAARGRPADAAELLQLAARSDIRDESIHQDMLRYVRGAAGGLATWPIIAFVAFEAALGGVFTAVLAPIAIGLYLARRRRLGRFPPEVRRLLNRRSLKLSAFESAGPAGYRPWWWRIVVRIPLATRVAVTWLLWLLWLTVPLDPDVEWQTSDWIVVLAFGAIPIFLTVRWIVARRRARAPHPFYGPADRLPV